MHRRLQVAVTLIALAALPALGTFRPALASSTPLSGNPLVMVNTATGAQAVMFPSTQWLAQHPLPTVAGVVPGSTAAPASSGLSSTTCTLGTDDSAGDAHVVVNSSDTQFDSLDLSAFGLSSNSTTLTGEIATQSLSDGTPVNGTPAPATPQVAGGGDIWYVVWNYGNDPSIKGYFLEAEYPGDPSQPGYTNSAATSNLPVSFSWGTIVNGTTGTTFQPGGPATGTLNTTNNTLSITAPLSSVGSPPAGSTLSSPYAEGDALLGTSATGGLLETADTLTSSMAPYQVGMSGTNCPGPANSTHTGALPTAGSANNLAYYGGPTTHTIHNHIIWWIPKAGTTTYSNGTPCTIPATVSYSYEQPTSSSVPVSALPGGPDGDTDYQQIIRQYFQDLSGSAFYNLLGQYSDLESGAPSNAEDFAGDWTDNCGYTSTPSTTTGPVPGGTMAAPIYQADIQAEVQRAIQINNWPTGLGNEYFVYTGYGVADCFAPPGQQGSTLPACDIAGPYPAYCAYHGDFMDSHGNYVLYADMTSSAFQTAFACYESPIGTTDPTHNVNGKTVTDPIADAEVSITSHEEFETASDAEVGTAQQLAPPLAWYDAVNGEIGDKCAYIYGNYASDGSNIVLHGDHYIVQEEYSNWNNGCGLTAYQNNGGYGGAPVVTPIQKGWNLISVPVSGITSASQLVAALTGPGQLPAGSIAEVQTYQNGRYYSYFPGKSKKDLALTQTEGVLVESTAAGTWTPSGAPYTSGPTIQLNPGWNLVAATYPNPGLMTDSIYNQIAAQAGACSAAILTNTACSPTITEIKAIGAGGQVIDWKPAPADASGNATWPQTQGNQIPFTSGMWIYATKPLTWTVQGPECQTVDSAGQCH